MRIVHVGLSFVTDVLRFVLTAIVVLAVAVLGIWGITMHLFRLGLKAVGLKRAGVVFVWLAWPTQKVMDWFTPRLVQAFPALETLMALSEREKEEADGQDATMS